MSAQFRRPANLSDHQLQQFDAQGDPAALAQLARTTAHTLLARARGTEDVSVIKRLVHYTDEHGIDAIAELWEASSASSLPGVLWRIYRLRSVTSKDLDGVSHIFSRGLAIAHTIDPIVVGLQVPVTPETIRSLSERVLRGVFAGDFALALHQAAAFSRIMTAGCNQLADEAEACDPDAATALTQQAELYWQLAADFQNAAALWERGALD